MGIKIKNLEKKYDDRVVLDIDELDVEEGLIYGVVGANGAGKSTLLKIIAGLEEATKGEVFLDNNGDTDLSRIITYSNQKPYMFNASVFNNIDMPLKYRKIDGEIRKIKVDRIIKEFKLETIKNAKATRLSGGETQKVALARALVFDPKVVLLDEPTANIDPEYIEFIEGTIRRKNEEEKSTIIIITHNIKQAFRLCHKIIFMDKGRVIKLGSKDEIFKCDDERVKKFLSSEILL